MSYEVICSHLLLVLFFQVPNKYGDQENKYSEVPECFKHSLTKSRAVSTPVPFFLTEFFHIYEGLTKHIIGGARGTQPQLVWNCLVIHVWNE